MLSPTPAGESTAKAAYAATGTTSALAQTQRAANIACGDPAAHANRRLTVVNYLWLSLGGVLWALILLGLLLPGNPTAI